MSGEKILEPGTELYSVATGRLSLLRKRSRDAARLMGEQDGFVAVHIVEDGRMMWFYATEADAKRARNVAAPINAQRFGLSTPCTRTGACMDCKSPDTICCQFLITRFSRHKDRIHVILVNERLGF